MKLLPILRHRAKRPFASRALASSALMLLMAACVGCAPAADKKAGKKSKDPEETEQPSQDSGDSSKDDALGDFASRFRKRYKKLNHFACEIESDLCVELLSDADKDDIKSHFFLAFENLDLKTSQHAKYLSCFTKALDSAKDCIEDCEESDEEDDEDSECSESAMNSCVDAFTDDHLDDCDLEDPSAPKVFRRAMTSLHSALDDGGGG